MERFSLSERQASAILEMRLARLTGLARKEVEDEHRDLHGADRRSCGRSSPTRRGSTR